MKVWQYYCLDCQQDFEYFKDKEEEVPCISCGSKNLKILPCFAGYKIKGDNSSSVKPKHTGSFKGKIK